MPLSDLQVFSEYAQTAMTETLAQQVQLFNAASAGGITLRSSAHDGDFSDQAIYAKISGLVRRRNAHGSGSVSAKVLSQLLDTSVKIGAGTPPVEIDPGMFRWIQKSPEEGGVIIGKQMAEDTLADMLNTALLAYRVAVGKTSSIVHDATATSIGGLSGGATNTASLGSMNAAAGKFGDSAQNIVSWIAHSKVLFDLYGEALSNTGRLFQFGNVRIIEDGFGRPIVVTDSPSLVKSSKYYTAGLVSGAIIVDQNNDYDSNVSTTNGDENLERTFQAEWSYNIGLKGYAWDKGSGGASPNDTALGTAANWDKYTSSDKDGPGVLLISG